MSDMKGFVSFEFNLPGALLEQLIVVFDELAAEQLTAKSVREIPDAQGVYQLYLDDDLVYVGKTDAEAGLRRRLQRHANKILHRPDLETHVVAFKAIQVLVFTAIDLETMLIKHYRQLGSPPSWNGSGFGSNDPGRERETTNRRPEGFDDQFPISIDIEGGYLPEGSHRVADALAALKAGLNYTFRYETVVVGGRARRGQLHADFVDASFQLANGRTTVREIITAILGALPDGWQATAFASHMILYKENRRYTYGEAIRKV